MFRSVAWSSVGKKLISGFTGLMLVGFLVVHLLGNLTLFIGADAFNHYAYFLEHLIHGWLIYAFEAGLILLFVFHGWTGIVVAWFDKEGARPVKYALQRNAGGKSRKSLSSRSMIITGLVLLVFLVIHVKMFKYAHFTHVTRTDGHEMKDLYAVVVAAFDTAWIAFAYVGVMILLGFHLRHGFWSAFQSLGWNNDRALPVLEGLALLVALVLAVGFVLLPLYIHFFVDPAAATAALPGGL